MEIQPLRIKSATPQLPAPLHSSDPGAGVWVAVTFWLWHGMLGVECWVQEARCGMLDSGSGCRVWAAGLECEATRSQQRGC